MTTLADVFHRGAFRRGADKTAEVGGGIAFAIYQGTAVLEEDNGYERLTFGNNARAWDSDIFSRDEDENIFVAAGVYALVGQGGTTSTDDHVTTLDFLAPLPAFRDLSQTQVPSTAGQAEDHHGVPASYQGVFACEEAMAVKFEAQRAFWTSENEILGVQFQITRIGDYTTAVAI